MNVPAKAAIAKGLGRSATCTATHRNDRSLIAALVLSPSADEADGETGSSLTELANVRDLTAARQDHSHIGGAIIASDGIGAVTETQRAPLLIADDDGWQRTIPPWLLGWMKLGTSARRWADDGDHGRLVVAVSAPTRAFAAVAVAFGHAVADYRRDRRLPSKDELSQYVDALTEGTLVRLVQPGWVRVAHFGGREGRELIRMGDSRFSLDKILEIMPLPAGLAGRPTASPVPTSAGSLAELLPGRDLCLFLTDACVVSLLIGTKKALKKELELRVRPPEATAPPSAIRELVRPFDPSVPIGWRSVVVPAVAERLPPVAMGIRTLLAILDGAQAVHYWLRNVDAAVLIAILDRSHPGSQAAASALLQARARAAPVQIGALGWTVPQGCEALAFREVL